MIAKNSILELLIEAKSEREVNQVLAKLEDKISWRTLAEPIAPNEFLSERNAIFAIAHILNDAIGKVVSLVASEKKIDTAQLSNNPDKLRDLLFPENAAWINFKAMETIASNVCIHGDGDRFETNLIFLTSGYLSNPGDLERGLLKYQTDNIWQPILRTHPHAIQFCGAHNYLLQAEKLSTDLWNWTLVRKNLAHTNFEYLVVNGTLPVQSSQLRLSLTSFIANTTSLQKLFNYRLPKGSRSVIAKDLLERVQEHNFNPIIPILLIDQPVRYSYDRFLKKVSFGQKFKLKHYRTKYLDHVIEEECDIAEHGKALLTCYLFKFCVNGQHEQSTKYIIKRTFFKNGMSIVLMNNGIVNRHLDIGFVEFELGLPNLKNHLLVSVDCGGLDEMFRYRLFSEDSKEGLEIIKEAIKSRLQCNEILRRENLERSIKLT